MARFELEGIDEMLSDMRRMGELTGDVATAVLQAGAEGVKRAWREAADRKGLVDTGDMLESIGFSHTPKTAGDIKYIDIYPQGKDHKGVRNAEKAFVLHYGTSRIKPTRWVDLADELSETYAVPAMQKVWEDYLTSGQVPNVPLTPNRPGGHDGNGH